MSKAKTELYGVVPSHQVDDARGPAFLFLGSPFPLARVGAARRGQRARRARGSAAPCAARSSGLLVAAAVVVESATTSHRRGRRPPGLGRRRRRAPCRSVHPYCYVTNV